MLTKLLKRLDCLPVNFLLYLAASIIELEVLQLNQSIPLLYNKKLLINELEISISEYML